MTKCQNDKMLKGQNVKQQNVILQIDGINMSNYITPDGSPKLLGFSPPQVLGNSQLVLGKVCIG
jgi:hypothetical protein